MKRSGPFTADAAINDNLEALVRRLRDVSQETTVRWGAPEMPEWLSLFGYLFFTDSSLNLFLRMDPSPFDALARSLRVLINEERHANHQLAHFVAKGEAAEIADMFAFIRSTCPQIWTAILKEMP